jgi:hypothetical protein
MTPPNVKRHLVCPTHGKWEIEVGENERCPSCGVLGEPICACGCRSSLSDLRSDAVYRSEACAKRLQRRGRPDVDPTGHPLQTVRDEQATKKHNRDLGGLIRQAILDRIKTTGECFADDLVDLYPEGEVGTCRRLATAQFGSMVASGLIREKERRRSTIPARKGAKSGVYVFTEEGRATLVGNSGGTSGASSGGRAAVSGEKASTGVPGSPNQDGVTSSPTPSPVAEGSEASSSPSGEPVARLFEDSPPSAYDQLKDVA